MCYCTDPEVDVLWLDPQIPSLRVGTHYEWSLEGIHLRCFVRLLRTVSYHHDIGEFVYDLEKRPDGSFSAVKKRHSLSIV